MSTNLPHLQGPPPAVAPAPPQLSIATSVSIAPPPPPLLSKASSEPEKLSESLASETDKAEETEEDIPVDDEVEVSDSQAKLVSEEVEQDENQTA